MEVAFDFISKTIDAHQYEVTKLIRWLRTKLVGYDSQDLAALCGGLRLVPANASRQVRLDAFSHAVATLPPTTVRQRQIERSVLEALLTKPPIQGGFLNKMEDPFAGTYCNEIAFFGGTYLSICGVTERDHFSCQVLLGSIFHSDDQRLEVLKNIVYPAIHAALILSDLACRRAGLKRGQLKEEVPKTLEIPLTQRLHDLKLAVTFSEEQLAKALNPYSIDSTSLSDLILATSECKAKDYRIQDGPLFERPFVRSQSSIILLSPTTILHSLKLFIVRVAAQLEVIDVVNDIFHKSISVSVAKQLDRIGMVINSQFARSSLDEPPCTSFTTDFDRGHKAFVVVITEDLRTLHSTGLNENWVTPQDATKISDFAHNARKACISQQDPRHRCLGIIVSQSVFRPAQYTFSTLKHKSQSPVVILEAQHLEVISWLPMVDQTTLWKFCRVRFDAVKRWNLSAFGFGEEFGAYIKSAESFYVNDSITVGAGLLLSVGYWDEPCRIVHEEVDPRFVQSFDGDVYQMVVLAHGSQDIEIYSTLQSRDGFSGFFVEGRFFKCWVTFKDDIRNLQFSDLLSFWMWKLSQLPNIPEELKDKFLYLQLHCDPDGDWASPRVKEDQVESGAIRIVKSGRPDSLEILIRPEILPIMMGPTNAGERHIMTEVLSSVFKNILGLDNESDCQTVQQIVNQVIPLSRMKRITIVTSDHEANWLRSVAYGPRLISRAEVGLLLDEIGDYVRKDLGVAIGMVSKEDRLNLYRSIVTYLYKKLQFEVSNLSSDHLLEFLLLRNETLVYSREVRQLRDTTRIACFGDDVRQSIVREHFKESEAAIATRFLIEYVAAKPPSGNNTIGYCDFDRIVAICSVILSYAMESDFIFYDLTELNVSVLPSGRVGCDREQLERAKASYFAIMHHRKIANDENEFDALLSNSAPSNLPKKLFPEAWDKVVHAEFGFSLTDIISYSVTASRIAEEAEHGVIRIETKHFLAQMSEELNWALDKSKALLDLLSLKAREDYLDPAPPHRRSDVEPWNFGRSLSFVRRPFVHHCDTVVFSAWHLAAFMEYFIYMFRSGRFRANSPELKAFTSKIKHEESKRFELDVKDRVNQIEGVFAIAAVRKVKNAIEALSDYGDLDVVVTVKARKLILLVECKDLNSARTAAELSWEIASLSKGAKGEQPTVRKHSDRVEWAKRNLTQLLLHLKISEPGEGWNVEGIVVTSAELLTSLLIESPMPIMSVDTFCDSLTKTCVSK